MQWVHQLRMYQSADSKPIAPDFLAMCTLHEDPFSNPRLVVPDKLFVHSLQRAT